MEFATWGHQATVRPGNTSLGIGFFVRIALAHHAEGSSGLSFVSDLEYVGNCGATLTAAWRPSDGSEVPMMSWLASILATLMGLSAYGLRGDTDSNGFLAGGFSWSYCCLRYRWLGFVVSYNAPQGDGNWS